MAVANILKIDLEEAIINTYGEKGERGDTHGRALKRARGVARERAERL